MRFTLSQSKHWCTTEEKEELEQFGLTFKPEENERWAEDYGEWCFASAGEVEISSLDDLLDIIRRYGQIVLSEGEIEIYNGYRE